MLLALAQLIGAAGTIVARRRGLAATSDGTPMMAIGNATPERVDAILADYRAGLGDRDLGTEPVVAIRNGRTAVIVAGAPRHLKALRARCEQIAAAEADRRKRKLTGGAPFTPKFDDLAVSLAFHHPSLAEAVEMVAQWADDCGIDRAMATRLASDVLVNHVDWVSIIDEVVAGGSRWILDFGPSDLATRLTSGLVRGRGVGQIGRASCRERV